MDETFPDSPFDNRALRLPIAHATLLDPGGGSEGILEEITLAVLEVYPGIGDAPLAISEIYVFGTNGKK